MDLGISGRLALVCASSKGLGFACARALGEAGARLVINGRDEARLAAAEEELRAAGCVVSAIVADLATEKGRSELIEACPAPDILVTNNGGPAFEATVDIGREGILSAIEQNLLSAVELIQSVAPAMARNRFGRVVNITSASVEMPLEGLTSSSVARSGLSTFSSALARRYASSNVTINCIEPGFFATDRVLELSNSGADEALSSMQKKFNAAVPANRLGDPAEVGALCAFLCSTRMGYLTGQRILIDGGLVVRF